MVHVVCCCRFCAVVHVVCCCRFCAVVHVVCCCRFCAVVHVNRELYATSYAQSKKEAKRRAAEETMMKMMAYENVTAHTVEMCHRPFPPTGYF